MNERKTPAFLSDSVIEWRPFRWPDIEIRATNLSTMVGRPGAPNCRMPWMTSTSARLLVSIYACALLTDLPDALLSAAALHTGDIDIAAILPDCTLRISPACLTLPFSRRFVSSALEVSVDALRRSGRLNFITGSIRLRYANSGCDSAVSVNEAINFYLKKQVHVFIGPCCDYAAAPIARQVSWFCEFSVRSGSH